MITVLRKIPNPKLPTQMLARRAEMKRKEASIQSVLSARDQKTRKWACLNCTYLGLTVPLRPARAQWWWWWCWFWEQSRSVWNWSPLTQANFTPEIGDDSFNLKFLKMEKVLISVFQPNQRYFMGEWKKYKQFKPERNTNIAKGTTDPGVDYFYQ